MGFSEQLRNARLKAGYTQQQVADLMGITKSTYCGYETGKRQPDVEKIKQLATILNTPSDILLETGFKQNDMVNSSNITPLTPHDERDIKRDLDRIMGEIRKGDNGPLYYNGVEISDASVNLLQNAIEFALKETKIENKKKYSPNKNKK